MDYVKLKAVVGSHPDAVNTSNDDMLTWLETPSIVKIESRLVSVRGLMGEIGPQETDAIMKALENAANVDGVVARVVHLMQPSEGGVDLGNIYTRGSIDNLALGGVLTPSQASLLKSVAEKTITPLENYGLTGVTEGDLIYVRGNL